MLLHLKALLVVSLAALTGCAPNTPVSPAPGTASPVQAPAEQDLKALAGKWEGTVHFRSGRSTYATMTIDEEGRWQHWIPGLTNPGPFFIGTVAVVEGKYRYKSRTTGGTGTFAVRRIDGQRVLTLEADDGIARGEYRPAAR